MEPIDITPRTTTTGVSIHPSSIAADHETPAEPETNDYLVLRRDETDVDIWHDVGVIKSVYIPTASEVGREFGAGDFMLIEQGDRYSFRAAYPIGVIAETVYKLREDES